MSWTKGLKEKDWIPCGKCKIIVHRETFAEKTGGLFSGGSVEVVCPLCEEVLDTVGE